VCARDGVAHDVAAKPRAAKPRPTRRSRRPRGEAAALRHVAAKPRAAKPRIVLDKVGRIASDSIHLADIS